MADPRFFTKSRDFSLAEIADLVGGELTGADKPEWQPVDVAPLDDAGPEHITFFQNRRYKNDFKASKAGACFVDKASTGDAPDGMALVVCEDPYKAYAVFVQALYPGAEGDQTGFTAAIDASADIPESCIISHGAVIGRNVEMGENCIIGPNVTIGHGVVLGDHVRVEANASLSYCIIGSHVTICAGVVIGQRGFGFAPDPERPVKIPQIGRVIIEDYVEVGASSTIDRGSGPDTVIGAGTMIDNLVQIAHNVKVGKCCILVAQAGISGSTELGDHVVVGGQTGIVGHLKVGSGVQIAGKSGVIRDVAPKEILGGIPAVPIRQWHKQTAALRKMTSDEGE